MMHLFMLISDNAAHEQSRACRPTVRSSDRTPLARHKIGSSWRSSLPSVVKPQLWSFCDHKSKENGTWKSRRRTQKLKNKTSAVSRFWLVSGALQPSSAEA